MKTDVFKLPSGVEIGFRQIMLREESFLAKSVKSRRAQLDKVLSDVINRCCEGVVDPGPYSFLKEGDKPNWDEMLRGDRFVTMIKLRMLSYRDGYEYDVDLRCPACNKKFNEVVNLEEDLFIQDLPEESVNHLKTGEPLTVEIAGRKVSFGLPLGKTEALAKKISNQNPDREMAAMLRSRILDVDGVDRRDILNWLDGEGRGDKFEGLTSDDAEELRDAFDRVDGGIDTEMEAECPDCGHIWNYDLPFDKIFMPSRKIRDRKRAMREARKTEEHPIPHGTELSEDSTKTT